uniref:NLR family CARD domain containing 5 n=1 Tax=Ursus americanus TaxID=9643 RepID=A0A452RSD6_URSAM
MDPVSLQLGTNHLWSWLVRLLSKDPEWLNAKVKFFLPKMDLSSEDKAQDASQGVILQLGRLHTQGRATWQAFIHCVCMELDVPLDLEVLLLSTWGHGDGFPSQLETGEESQPASQLHHGEVWGGSAGGRPAALMPTPPPAELARKYLQLLKTSAQQRYAGGSPGPGQPLAFHQAYIPPILQWSRTTAPIHTQEGATLAEDGTDVSIRDLFNTRADKGPRVTVLLGKAGMGKTTLAHRLCQRWADGQLDRFQALFLFEFRQLNLVTCLLTLPQLLFDLYVSPEAGSDSVFRYLEDNADGVLLIFDGLDQALHPHCSREKEGPEDPSPALALFSGLCRGTLLPGCWVLATSRPGKLPDCLPVEAATVHMWGFDRPRMEEYVGRVFSDPLRQEAALAELRESRHLRSMCAVPALCWVTCLCLHRLLPGSSPGQAAALLPTVTQNYVQMVATLGPRGCLPPESLLDLSEVALRGLETGKVLFSVGDIHPSTMAFGAALGLLTSFCICTGPGHQDTGYAFTHLSLQEFFAALYLMASPKVDKTALVGHVTLNSHWVLRTKARPGLLDHLPTFLAGLASCACRPFLSLVAQRDETWVSAKQAAVMQALRKLAARRLTGPKVVALCHCVGETQEPELASLVAQSLPYHLSFHNFPLTYTDLAALTNILGHRNAPIHLDFEGCPLEPHCPEALAGCKQVENLSRSEPCCGRLSGSKITARGIGHLVPALRLCPQLEEVSFQDNQLKDWAVLNIVEVLPCLPQLQKLDLSRNNVSVSTLLCLTKVAVACPTVRALQVRSVCLLTPVAHTQQWPLGPEEVCCSFLPLAPLLPPSRLQQCHLRVHDVQELIAQLQEGPHLDVVDLSGNQLDNEGCRLMAEATSQLRIARKLDLSDNGLSVDGVHCVLSAASTCQTLEELHISLLHKTVVFTFAPEPEQQKGIRRSLSACGGGHCLLCSEGLCFFLLRLTHCGLHAKHLEPLCRALRGSCRLGHLDFSGNALGDEGVAQLARLLPGLGALQSLDLSENGLSLDAVLMLAPCFATLQWLLHLDIRGEHLRLHKGPGPSLTPCPAHLPPFSLSQCQLEPLSLTRLCETLEKCPGPLEEGVSGPRGILGLWPRVADSGTVCARSLYHVTLHFKSSEEREGECCGFTDCGLSQEHVEPLCWLLSKCEELNQLDLSANMLGDDGLQCLLECLPQLPISGSLDLSHNSISLESALGLVKTLPSCPRVREASVNLGSEQSFWMHFSRQEEAGKTLRLSQCSFGPEHVPRLAAGLNQSLKLTALTLTQCCLGLEQLTLLLSLLRWPVGLFSLRVEEPWVGKAGVLALLEVCTQASGNVTEISISETQQQLCLQLEFPRQENPEAVALRLAHCDLGTHHNLLVWRLMETCARLRQLSLSQVNLCDTSSLLLPNLTCCPLTPTRLTSSCVSSKGLAHVMSGLSHCYHLEELDNAKASSGLLSSSLSHLPLGSAALAELTQGLSHMTLLQSLRLSHNQIRDIGAQHLAAVLSELPELRKIDLSGNGIGPAGGVQLAESLCWVRGLWEGPQSSYPVPQAPLTRSPFPSLPSSGLSLEGLLILSQALDGCPYVEEISLAENSLAIGVPHFRQGLPLLRQIELSWNLLGDEAAAELAQVLPQMGRLKRMDLEKNRITACGAWLLVEGLAQGSGIQVIRLWNNPISPDVAQHLQSQEPRLDFAFFDKQPQPPRGS